MQQPVRRFIAAPLILLSVMVMLVARPGAAQDTTRAIWTVQFPPLDFSHPIKLCAVNDTLLYYISDGFLLRSGDAGVTWTRSDLPGCFTPRGATFVGTYLGWLVGDKGTVYKTTDGGFSWVYKRLPTTAVDLRYVSFASARVGWVSGSFGLVLKTTDGGDSWTWQGYYDFFHGGSESYTYVHAVSESIVWAARFNREYVPHIPPAYIVDLTLLRTTDGGITWRPSPKHWDCFPEYVELRNQHAFLRDFSSVFTCDASHASLFFRPQRTADPWFRYTTTDGGATWDSILFPVDAPTRIVRAFDCGTAWGTDSAQAHLYRSVATDTLQWQPRTFPCTGACTPYTYDFVDTATGFCFVDNGNTTVTIYRTTDGAATWIPQSSHVLNRGTLVDVAFLDPDRGWAVGNDSTRNGIVMRTTDRGTHWNVLLPAGAALHGVQHVQFIDSTTGWILGDSLYHTTDAGASWRVDSRFPLDTLRPGVHYVWAQFVTPQTGWIVRSDWYTMRTTDGGATWNEAHQRDTAVTISVAHAMDANSLIAMGTVSDSAYEFRILDGGLSSQLFPLIPPNGNAPVMPAAMFFLDSLNGWFVDTLPNLYVTHDGGLNWDFVWYVPSLRPTTSLFFTDTSEGWLTTGSLYLVNDWGNPFDPYFTRYLLSRGSIQRLTGGANSVAAERCILNSLNAITFIGDTLGWAVGEDLTVYHYYVPAASKPRRRPMLVLGEPVLDFGAVNQGHHASLPLMIRNGGDDTLVISGVATPDDKYQGFHFVTICPIRLAPGDSVVAEVRFDPTFLINYSATLYIYSNDDSQYVYLRGVGELVGVAQNITLVPTRDLIRCYPHPVSDNTTFIVDPTMPDVLSLAVYDAIGRVVATVPANGSREVAFNAAHLAAGAYVVEARTPRGAAHSRFAVMH